MTKDKILDIEKDSPHFDAMRRELLRPKAAMNIDIKTDAFLDATEQQLKDASGDELEMLSKLYSLDADVQSKAVQGIVDYTAEVIAKATAIMTSLDLSKLANAVAAYQQTHEKNKTEPKAKASKVEAAYEGKVMMQDNILNGFTYQQLADAVNANWGDKTKITVEVQFEEMVAESVANAKEGLNAHMAEIIKAATDIEG